MKLVVLSDTHGQCVDNVPDGDVLIHCGDYSLYGEYIETKEFFDWFSSFSHKHKIVIPGNHEVAICPLHQRASLKKVAELILSYKDKVKFLVDEKLVIDGIKFYGTPWCPGERWIMARWGFYLEKDEDRKKMFDKIPDDTDVLISHSPPYDILDKYNGRTLGCPMLLERVRQVNPRVHVFGHIHGSNGHVKIGDTDFYNCSNLSESYKITFPCRVIEL